MVRKSMAITLTPEQEAWCNTHVASGDFASVEEAARQLIDERIAERALEEGDDLAWAKPYVDTGWKITALKVAKKEVNSRDKNKDKS